MSILVAFVLVGLLGLVLIGQLIQNGRRIRSSRRIFGEHAPARDRDRARR